MSAILAVKTKNAIRRCAEDAGMIVEFSIKNIDINGSKRGCRGFVRNTENGSVVYVNTESSCASWIPPIMYRYADSMIDYTGYRNRFTHTLEELAIAVVTMLKKTPQEAGDIRL